MARIFITGSSDGIGLLIAKSLISSGHEVVLHARNDQRAADALRAAPGAASVLVADLSSIQANIGLAHEANKTGGFDAVIHNAGVGYREPRRGNTVDGLPPVFAVNSLSPYILTSLINRPKRIVYTSSGLHRQGDGSLEDLEWNQRTWSGYNAYSDSKLHDVLLAFAVARKWEDVYSNAVEPGWVATKMGGAGAPDSLSDAPKTQVWLATGDDAKVTGRYYFHEREQGVHAAAFQADVQDRLLAECERISGVKFE